MESQKISFIQEYEDIQSFLPLLPLFDPFHTLVLNVDPLRSSLFLQRVINHCVRDPKSRAFIQNVSIPEKGESDGPYSIRFKFDSMNYNIHYDKIIVCSVETVHSHMWIHEILMDNGYEKDDIVYISLYEKSLSLHKADYIGRYLDSEAQFYWE